MRDEGKGIDAKFLATIFEKFPQGSLPGERSQGGLGLGMAIVKHLVELHGGHVTVHSAGLGHGTTVSLEIPAHGAPIGESELSVLTEKLEIELNLSGVVALVVEDEPQNREMLSMILRDRGVRVLVAADCTEALLALDVERPNVLVSDVGLPGKDGYELMRVIRRNELEAGSGQRLPAIALTAFGRPEDIEMAKKSGFDVHLPKPLVAHDLLLAIQRFKDSSVAAKEDSDGHA